MFYLKLLVESVDHNGELRFSDTIPYNEQMLSTITNTNIDVVRAAMKVFTELKMIEIYDNQTIYLAEIQKMLGCETYWAEQKRKTRIGQSPENVLAVSNMSNQEKEIDKETDIKENIGAKSTRFTPPTLEEVTAYCKERNNGVNPQRFIDFYESKGWVVGKVKMKSWKAAVRTWEPKDDKPVEQEKAKPKNLRPVEVNGEIVMEVVNG